mmetsp:Transcript_23983/g.68709  ORF Transcript_23983/g.68709 Transcript_23983/m.68709 type:complete len:93 (-) Transcript_23983:504-782(-)
MSTSQPAALVEDPQWLRSFIKHERIRTVLPKEVNIGVKGFSPADLALARSACSYPSAWSLSKPASKAHNSGIPSAQRKFHQGSGRQFSAGWL